MKRNSYSELNICDRFSDRSGVSMVIALVFMLFCITLGSLVVISASAAFGRFAGIREGEQSYLSVSSAASMVKELITASRYETEKASGYAVEKGMMTGELHRKSAVFDIFEAPLTIMCDTAFVEGNPPSSRELGFRVSGDTNLHEVGGTLQMSSDGSLQVDLWTGEGDEKNHTVLKVSAPRVTKTQEIIEHEYEEEEEDEEGNSVTVTKVAYTYIDRTFYSWERSGVTIERGN